MKIGNITPIELLFIEDVYIGESHKEMILMRVSMTKGNSLRPYLPISEGDIHDKALYGTIFSRLKK